MAPTMPAKAADERFERLTGAFRRVGDAYVMLRRAVDAFEEYKGRAAEAAEKHTGPDFAGFLRRAEAEEMRIIDTAMGEIAAYKARYPAASQEGVPEAQLAAV